MGCFDMDTCIFMAFGWLEKNSIPGKMMAFWDLTIILLQSSAKQQDSYTGRAE